jgi:hypothetical protein
MTDYTTYGHSVVHSETGVHLHLRNGITVSIQWKPGAYAGKLTVETAAWYRTTERVWEGVDTTDKKWVRVPGFSDVDDVNGWQVAEEVAAFISAADALDDQR